VFEAAPKDEALLTIRLHRDDIEKYAFVYKEVLGRAGDLRRDFYAAYDTE
jgi:hypothetical protein